MFVSVDVGTTSVKIALIDSSGRIVKACVIDNPISHPEPGTAEQSLNHIVKSVINGISSVVRGFESRVESITLITYMGALGLLDKDFNILRDAMIHIDTRGIDEQRELEWLGREIYERTGCPPLFMYPPYKVLWLKKRRLIPSNARLTFVKDYIVYKLSNIYAIDYGTASANSFLNIYSLVWDDLILKLTSIDESMLPELIEGAKVLEYIRLPEVGLRDKVALVLGTHDGPAQNIGYSVYGVDAVVGIGSSLTLRLLTKDIVLDKDPKMRFYSYYVADGYRVIGSPSNNGGIVIDWFKSIVNREELRSLGRTVCSEGIYVLPFAVSEIFPFRDPNLTFTITGLRITHNVEHIVQGLYEGLAFIVKTAMNAFNENNVEVEKVHCAGGGCSNLNLVNTIANVLCKPVVLHKDPRNAGVLGGVIIAMRALGYIKTLHEVILDEVKSITTIEPNEGLCKDYIECHKQFSKFINMIQGITFK